MVDHLKNFQKYNFPLDRYDNEPKLKETLLKYRSKSTKRKKTGKPIKRNQLLVQNRFLHSLLPVEKQSYLDRLPKSYYIQQIRDAIAIAPMVGLLPRMRRRMTHQVLDRYNEKYPEIIKMYMQEVEIHYTETIRGYHSEQFAISNGENRVNDAIHSFKFKHSGRTIHYAKFIRHRKQIKDKLFLSYPFIRFILHSSNQSFPRVLNDYAGYRRMKSGICVWLELLEFENIAQRDLENKSIFLREEWYPKVVQVLVKHYKKRSCSSQQWSRMLDCAKGLINRQITELKLNTYEHIFEVFAQRAFMPPLKFQAICRNGRIELHPNFKEILSTFKRIFKSIAAIATKFPPLEPLIDRVAFITRENYLKIGIEEVTLNHMMDKLESALEVAYKPVLDYVESLEEEFQDLLSDETRDDLELFLSEPKHIDEYFAKISIFRGYILKIQQTVPTHIFDNAIVNQNKALVGLRIIAQDYNDEITEKIAAGHKNECQMICDWFTNVQQRALEAPKSTETLLANGEFMLQIKNKKIAEIRQHIQNNLKISGRLLDLMELSEDHFNLQISTIHWLHNIQEIFEQNASQFELYKNQFEEHLGAVTKKLTQDIEDLIPKLAIIDDMYDTTKLRDYYATLEEYIGQIKCFEDYIKWINKEEKLFKLPVSQYPIVESLQEHVKPFADLIKFCIEWLRYYYIWMDGQFEYLNPASIESLVDSYIKEFESTQKYYRNRIKADMLGDPVLKFRGQTEDPDPEKHPVPLRLCGSMIEWINGFQIGVQIVKIMCNPALRDRHWAEMSEIAGFDLTPDAGTSLRKITKYGIDHLLPSFEIISIGANKELKLQKDLTDMIVQWESIDFPIDVYKETEIKILGNIEDIQVLLDDHTIKTLSMRGSAFVKPCEHEVREWYEKLTRAAQIFDEWLRVQTGWLYLLPVLSSKDISAEMPTEEQLFTQVNGTYCKYISTAISEPNVMKLMETEQLLEDLTASNEMLEKIKAGVYAYLERKRLYFSRFFFLSNNELLQILSETKNPENIQPFLCKCFSGIWRVRMNKNETIDGMLSRMGEEITFPHSISMTKYGACVDKWLLGVEMEMHAAIKNEVMNSYADFITSDRINWVLSWPQMIVLVVANIFWTSDIHASLLHQNRDLLNNIRNEIQGNLDEITDIIRTNEMTNLNRLTLKTLCILDVHARDVTQKLIDDFDSNVDSFQWISQLRYYWIDNEVLIKTLNSSISYGNEYLGNFQRIVMTPLTERCMHSVLLAFQYQLNAWIEGPTATGKSETIKDLAKALAIQLEIFDCTPDLDFRSISQFLKGVASTGSWLCFEDFNRIEIKTLSVVAQQLRIVQMALRKRVPKFSFDGVEVQVKSSSNICIMSNPSHSRSMLPDNLKTLFRPFAMITPDTEQIVEVSLYAAGFKNAKIFARRIVEFFKVCSEFLPQQEHYDFGLRSIKTTIRMCANRIIHRDSDECDEEIICKSLIDVNSPKIIACHSATFRSIIDLIFRNVNQPQTEDHAWIREIYNSTCVERNFQPIEAQYKKLVEAYELIGCRSGLMFVGNPYTGKSFILRLLAKVIAQEKIVDLNDINISFINPQAIELKHLFDGIASSIFRQSASEANIKWIVFDGPVHCDWAENLNTVLDDNRKLCLSSGEALDLSDNMSFIFEVNNLCYASPSTISRIGIVYLESNTLSWQSMAKTWMNTCNKAWIGECKTFLWDLFEWILPLVIDFVNKHGENLINPLQYNLLKTTFDIIQMTIDDVLETNPDDFQKFLISWIQAATAYGIAWGIGGILNDESRKLFDQFHRKIWSCCDEYPPPNTIKNRLDISLPNEGCLNDYSYIFKQKGTWKLWIDIARRQEPEISQHGVYVATVDTARFSFLIEMHIKYGRNVMLVGPSATGKTFIMENILRTKIDPESISPATITFNLRTNAKDVHEEILSKLVKLKRGIYGPSKGWNCSIFIDNINIPHSGKLHTSHPSAEIIRQIFDYGFLYDLKSSFKIYLENLSILAACGKPGGRNHEIDLRFMNHFNCFSINEFSEETLTRIFSGVLMNGLKKSGHAADVIGSANQIISATMHVYGEIVKKLKATPKKSHYCFNMRDVLRVCIGCSLIRKESVENKKSFAKIWFHESLRVFHDRLYDADEKSWVYDRLTEQINDTNGTFKDSMEIVFENYVNGNSSMTLDSIKNLIFGSYLDVETDVPCRKYEEIGNLKKLANVAATLIDEHSDTILFMYALEHLNRICRIISMPGGNGLIIGYVDSGRKTLSRLATLVCKQKLCELRIDPDYNIGSWKEDIKRALRSAGGMNEQTVLFLSETHLTDAYLTDVDYLLNSGDIPNLWPIDEKQELLEMVRLVAQGGNRNIDISADEVFSFFVNRCHQNLHIILSFNSMDSKLRDFIRLYPSFVNCCTIDVFDKWPNDALEMVATKFLSELDLPDVLTTSIISACEYFHSTAYEIIDAYRIRSNNDIFVTPSSYLEFVNCFTKLMVKKQDEITTAKSRYVNGLETLEQAARTVECMQKELNELEPKLRAMADNCDQVSAEIELKTIEASVATEQVRRDELVANAQAVEAQVMEDECSKDLAQAVPVLEDALQALNTLKPADITLVKSMKNPPSAVKLVMAAVCVMKAVPPDRINDAASGKKIVDYWGPSKRILGDMGFLQSLKDYDKDDISPDIMKKIRKDFIQHKDFQPQIVAKASSAAEGLCKWVKAIENFEAVNTVVRPKKLKLMKAKENLKETRKYLIEKRALAAELEAKVEGLHTELEKTNSEKEHTEREVENCEQKLDRAESLINNLGQEKDRWTQKVVHLQELLNNLAGDVLISSGLIAYLGALPKLNRDQCIRKWHDYCKSNQISCSEKFSLISCLGHEEEIQYWQTLGLAHDESMIENIILMMNSGRQCLLIDPQLQAKKWIKRIEYGNHLKIIKQTDPKYFEALVNSMENGHPVLIEDISESLNICLEQTFTYRKLLVQDRKLHLHSHRSIEVSPKFQLYLTSNARNANFLTNNNGKINVINFMFALSGLEETLLDILVLKENPYLREERDQLLQEKLEDKTKQLRCEDAILTAISECEGDILENESAIRKMDGSKQHLIAVIDKQTFYAEAEHKIGTYRESYRRVSSYAAILYNCLDHLRYVNPMYQYSLDWFFNMYDFAIENANRSRELNRRIDFLIKSITKNLYHSICRSIFDKDKLLFSWIITTKMLLDDERLKIDQLNFFIAEEAMVATMEKPNFEWMSDKMWNNLNEFAKLLNFDSFLSSFVEHNEEWKSYYDDRTHDIPIQLRSILSSFEKLIILKIFHPEDLTVAITDFIAREIGEQFVNPPHFNIHKSFDESNILTPLIFILSPGVDPTETLWLFAEKLGYSHSMQMISLGADQNHYIEAAILKAQKQGSWICLQNCHLNTVWLMNVEKMWKNMNLNDTASSFRLWMTSEPTEQFPLNLLQNGIKITYENAGELKSKLLNSYRTSPLNTDFYDKCPEQDKTFKQLLYSLSFFDVVVNERKKYGSIGWNVDYEFVRYDFVQSIQQLQVFLNNRKFVPFDALYYVINECCYGGQIIDEFDKRLLKTILKDIFNKNVLEDPFFKLAPDDGCILPRRFEHRMVLKFIEETVPSNSDCEFYGLNRNSEFVYKLETSNRLLYSMRLTSQDGENIMLSNHAKSVSDLTWIIEKLPQRLILDKCMKSENDAITTVLIAEMGQYNRLLELIQTNCHELHQALEGDASFTPELEQLFECISRNVIPDQWIKISYPSQKGFSSYLNDFCERYKWFSSWWQSDENPHSFWISAFFHPRSLLTAIKLNFAIINDISLEQLTLDFNVLNEMPVKDAESGAYIHGLFLRAAHWTGNYIDEQLHRTMIEEFPTIHIKPIRLNDLKLDNRYECPVYCTSEQRSIHYSSNGIYERDAITYVLLPAKDEVPQSFWIKCGVVLVCQKDE